MESFSTEAKETSNNGSSLEKVETSSVKKTFIEVATSPQDEQLRAAYQWLFSKENEKN